MLDAGGVLDVVGALAGDVPAVVAVGGWWEPPQPPRRAATAIAVASPRALKAGWQRSNT